MIVVETPQSVSCDELASMLSALHERGAHNFDPVRFSFIEAMSRRAKGRGESVTHIVEQAALKALDEYKADLVLAQEEAAASLDTADSVLAEELQRLFQACQFREIKRLLARTKRSNTSEKLASLSAHISNPEPLAASKSTAPSFEDVLRQNEQKLIQTGGNFSAMDESLDIDSVQGFAPHEQGAIHHFREALVKRNADKLVTKLINEIPKDAGPLNPQKLIVQSLASMRDLSPHYLNRFVAYIDTLLWLEKAGGK